MSECSDLGAVETLDDDMSLHIWLHQWWRWRGCLLRRMTWWMPWWMDESIVWMYIMDRWTMVNQYERHNSLLSVCVSPWHKTSRADTVTNLGVTIDNDLSMDSHISHVCRASYFEIRKLGQLRDYLDTNSSKIIASSCVLSRLDYCNSILASCPEEGLKKLQKVQNNAARLVLKKSKREHITPLLYELRLYYLTVKCGFIMGLWLLRFLTIITCQV